MAKNAEERPGKEGRRLALLIAGTGVFYVLATLIGDEYGWSNRAMGFVGLAALAGFGAALWMAIGLWRARQD